MSAVMSEIPAEASLPVRGQGISRADIISLTKLRLSALVIITTFFGFWLNSPQGINWMLLLHTVVGSTLAAFGAAIFNQLMEIGPDSRMKRTADRPLPARRVQPGVAFVMGWVLSAFALIHLVKMVNLEAAAGAALTLVVYLFLYTPMKQKSEWNTIAGAVSGALPPLIGWTGAAGPAPDGDTAVRVGLFTAPGAIYLFLLLFLWQMPHFLAINWMYRDQYRQGGFVMLANDDELGARTSFHALLYAVATLLLMFYPVYEGVAQAWFLAPALPLAGWLCWLAWKFRVHRERAHARKLFFCTLAYLPLVLILSVAAWKRA